MRSSIKKVRFDIYDREFSVEEIIRGLFGLDLPPKIREKCVKITKMREEAIHRGLPPEEGGGDFWYQLNIEAGGTSTITKIPTRRELWKIYDREGVDGLVRVLPSSAIKYAPEFLRQMALWGGCIDELDLYGFIMLFGYDEVLNACKRLADQGLIEYEEYEGIVPTGVHDRSIKAKYKARGEK